MDVTESTETSFHLSSAVFGGQPIAEIKTDGTKKKGKVYSPTGSLIAEHTPNGICSNCLQNTQWKESYLTGSFRYIAYDGGAGRAEERDPMGMNTGTEDPWTNQLEPMFRDIVGEQPMIEADDYSTDAGRGCATDPESVKGAGVRWT